MVGQLIVFTAFSGLGVLGGCREKTSDADTASVPEAVTCPTGFSYLVPEGSDVDQVGIAGTFNRWLPDATPMTESEPGLWSVNLDLEPGAYAYKFVETITWSQEGLESWICDPAADLAHCDEGYKEPSDTSWSHTCATGESDACNSMVVVPDCSLPTLTLTSLDITRAVSADGPDDYEGTLSAHARFAPGVFGDAAAEVTVSLDGDPLEGEELDAIWDGTDLTLLEYGLSEGRHTLRMSATDAAGRTTDEIYVPFWIDSGGEAPWRSKPMYFAFVDRFANGDTSLDGTESASSPMGDYMGGDLAGVEDMLPYLDYLGVGTIWISNPQGNAEGPWEGDCGDTYAAYHAYWPNDPLGVEEHFGDADALTSLVTAAHGRDMRVIMDWVANHVHEDHPYVSEHPEWFGEESLCESTEGGQAGWDRIPERCWFAPYLPDLDYTQPEVLDQMVEEALWWVRTYELDGLRVDAVKHMPHSVAWNLEARVRGEIEHRGVGGDEVFWTVGETFDGSTDRIAAYVSDGDEKLQLDGQFDFPLYFTLRDALATGTASLSDLQSAMDASTAAWDGALMGSFLGNHDVSRFITIAAEGDQSACHDDGETSRSAEPIDDAEAHARMRLAWTVLMSHSPVPLIYYGDEIGMPGYGDPDNRQPLWEHIGSGAPDTPDEVEERLKGTHPEMVETLAHVQALIAVRRSHPALWRGDSAEWWISDDVWGVARKDSRSGDQAIMLINRSGEAHEVSNGLAFAGLKTGGRWEDALSGERFNVSGDTLTVEVPAWSSLVLLPL